MKITTTEYNKLYNDLWSIFHACEGGYTRPAADALNAILLRIADNIHDQKTETETDNSPVYDWDC